MLLPALVVSNPPAPRPRAAGPRPAPTRVVAPTELPEVEPVELQELTPQDARAYNATVPFVDGPIPAARPFRFAGDEGMRARAIDCLAAAAWYEAGDDPVGQRAVVQVVLNRLRHPAFPKTVCGVVFQGAERATGCQFTFTCDGALARIPSAPAWGRAQDVAKAALNGAVFRRVGYATHYHTDWVVPYWSASLDKIAEVHTHLFFRWTGWWGTPPAFRRTVSSDEPAVSKLAQVSDIHRLGGALDAAALAVAAAAPAITGEPVQPVAGEPDTFIVALPAGTPESYPALAAAACGARATCKFMGWTDRAAVPPAAPPTPQQLNSMSFSYLRDRPAGLERELWNCTEFPRTGPGLCMRRQAMIALPAPAASPALAVPPRGPAPLDGVRRAEATPPQPSPTATASPRVNWFPKPAVRRPRTSPAEAP